MFQLRSLPLNHWSSIQNNSTMQ